MPGLVIRRSGLYAAVLGMLAALAPAYLVSQAAPDFPPDTSAPAPRPTQRPAVPANKTSAATQASVPVPAPVPPAAITPAWPVNQAPAAAVVQWDSRGLRISAKNSSLRQILAEVSTRIGAKLDGTVGDERVFGEYGPGPAKEVLTQLLQGSAYNLLLIGDQGQGTPRQIVLSARNTESGNQAAVNQPSQNADEDSSDTDVEDQPVRQAPLPRPPIRPQPIPPPQPQ
jgi:hypothetical protein